MRTKRSRAASLPVDPEVCIETFVDAADVAGGFEQLAKALRVPARLLESWMEGLEVPPHAFYLRAVEILREAGLPEPDPRRVKVACIVDAADFGDAVAGDPALDDLVPHEGEDPILDEERPGIAVPVDAGGAAVIAG